MPKQTNLFKSNDVLRTLKFIKSWIKSSLIVHSAEHKAYVSEPPTTAVDARWPSPIRAARPALQLADDEWRHGRHAAAATLPCGLDTPLCAPGPGPIRHGHSSG